MPEHQADEEQIYFEFTVPEGSVPTFANVVTTSALGGETILNFGFIDPIILEKQTEDESSDEESNVIRVPASLVSRLAINPLVAKSLLERLKEVLAEEENEE